MRDDLNSTKALIFRIVHRDNLPWILDHGLHSKKSGNADPNFVSIGNPDLIDRRTNHPVRHPLGGTLGDYIPFYFTPLSPMFYNIRTGYRGIRQRQNDEIVIIVSSLPTLVRHKIPFIYSDRHAYLATAQFFTELKDLTNIDWNILQTRNFRRNPEYPDRDDRYQAEALIRDFAPVSSLLGVICYNDEIKQTIDPMIADRNLNLKVITRPGWYFT